ncbi:hypothetical protein AN963_09880 [Brevibacillus choshinensis]|uniref:ABC transporter domain-containing protein n=1 Tax=Brevibacillus choshinensis TaxID=54911 RepID=A0ABR5NEH5_BRECH|nr:hypothetical protein AN963_09880 [Brevibacillus choshinensis]
MNPFQWGEISLLSTELEHTEPLIRIEKLVKEFKAQSPGPDGQPGVVKAVNQISLQIQKGETYGLVGESGCGKSTTGRMILRLIEPTRGDIFYKGNKLNDLREEDMRKMRQEMQIVFQDPYSSLNPRKRIGNAIQEPMSIFNVGHKKERKERVLELLSKVGLHPEQYDRYPHEFSGGQRQRIVLARALAVNPQFIVCDEPVSALDVSIQSQIINLFLQLKKDYALTYLFIAHDLSVVRHISDRIGVMYLGNLVEEAETDALFANPLHPYTKALLSAVPVPNPEAKRERIILTGETPSPLNPPQGCVFHTRCPAAKPTCSHAIPQAVRIAHNQWVSCHLYS